MTDSLDDIFGDQLLIPTRSTSRPLMLTPPAARRQLSSEPRPESPLAAQRPESPIGSTRVASRQIYITSTLDKPAAVMTTEVQLVSPVNASVLFEDFNSFLSKLPLKTLGCFLALIYGASMFFMLTELPSIWLVVVVSLASFIMFRVLGV